LIGSCGFAVCEWFQSASAHPPPACTPTYKPVQLNGGGTSSLMLRRPFASAVVDNHTSPTPAARHKPALRILFIRNLTHSTSAHPHTDRNLAVQGLITEGCLPLVYADVAQTQLTRSRIISQQNQRLREIGASRLVACSQQRASQCQ